MSELSNVLFRSLGLPQPVAAGYNDLTRRLDGNFDANNDGTVNELDRNGLIEPAEIYEEIFYRRSQYQPVIGQLEAGGFEDPYQELPEIKKHVTDLLARYQPATDLDKAILLFRSIICPAQTFKFGSTRYFGLEQNEGGLEIFPNVNIFDPRRAVIGVFRPNTILTTAIDRRIANCLEYNQLLVTMLRSAGITASAINITNIFGIPSHSEIVAIIDGKTYRLDLINLKFIEAPGRLVSDRINIADYYQNKGMIYLIHQRFEKALSLLELAIEINPVSEGAWYCKGLAYLNLNDLGQAAACFEKVINLQPTQAPAWELLALVLLKAGQRDKALAAANRAIEIDANSPTAWTVKASLTTSPTERESFLTKGAEAWTVIGDRTANVGLYRIAVSDYSSAIKLKENYYPAWKKRGQAFAKMGVFERAFADYEKVVLDCPTDADAWNGKGVIHLMLKQFQQAAICLDEALRFDPDNPKYLANRGIVFLHQNQLEQALNFFKKALRLDQNCTQARINLAIALALTNQLDAAKQQLDLVLAQEPDNTAALGAKIGILMSQNQYAAALQNIENYIDLNSMDGEIWLLRGKALAQLGQAAESEHSFRQAEKIKKFKIRYTLEN